MASTEAKNILLWFQVSLHTATKVIFIKFPVSKNPQGLLNNELTKKKKNSHVSPPLSKYYVDGLRVFNLHATGTFVITDRGPVVPQVLSILMEYTNKTLKRFLQPSWLNNSGHVCILPLLPKLSLQLQDPTNWLTNRTYTVQWALTRYSVRDHTLTFSLKCNIKLN